MGKRYWIPAVVLAGSGAGWLFFQSGDSRGFAVRVIGRTNDSLGQCQVLYEVTNRTTKDVIFGLDSVEAREGDGWRRASNPDVQRELHIRRMLSGTSVAAVRVIVPSRGTAVRGQIHCKKEESSLRRMMKAWARKLGVPSGFTDSTSTVFRDRRTSFTVLRLPEVEVEGEPFLLATSAAGVAALGQPVQSSAWLQFTRLDVLTVLNVYKELSEADLQIDPQVEALRSRITIYPKDNVTVPEGLRLIEAALREQAGIVLSRQESNRVVATYDKTLTLKPVK